MASPTSGLSPTQSHVEATSPSDSSQMGPVAHTLTACTRCRQRKTRCDVGLPRCVPCERIDAPCEYYDAAKERHIPRAYVVWLQRRVRELEQKLGPSQDVQISELSPATLVREAALIKIQGIDEPSYLGPSSGINMTRVVLELAKGIRKIKKIKDLVPEEQTRRIRERFEAEVQKPTSKDYPVISSVAAPDLPPLELTNMLVETFFKRGQYLYPLLHEPTFRKLVLSVYNGSKDCFENFSLRMVIALSMQKLSSQWTGLADSFYLAALPFLEATVKRRNIATIQSFMLIAQYSIVTPTRTAANWIVVLAVKLCQELGIAEEETIKLDRLGNPLDALEIDMRRRCYWICFAMEHGLAHSMGRPSAFGTSHLHMDVEWFQTVDDEYITRTGIYPAPPSIKKRVAQHFISMRLLQLEIRRTLYLRHRQSPTNDMDPWFLQMEQKLNDWVDRIPEESNGTAFNRNWLVTRLNTVKVFLYRPSPQIPEPSVASAQKAFDASKFNIESQRRQIDDAKVDLSWIFGQSLFMAINAVLWALSYAEVRKQNPRGDVSRLLDKALETAYYCSLKWPGVEGAMELYGTLCHTCLKAYDGDDDKSYSVGSPINRPSPTTTGSPEAVSSPGSLEWNAPNVVNVSGPSSPAANSFTSSHSGNPSTPSRNTAVLNTQHLSPNSALSHRTGSQTDQSANQTYDPNIFTNPLPALAPADVGALAPQNFYSPIFHPDTSMIMDPYSRNVDTSWAPSHEIVGLDLQQQSELMQQLETVGINGLFG